MYSAMEVGSVSTRSRNSLLKLSEYIIPARSIVSARYIFAMNTESVTQGFRKMRRSPRMLMAWQFILGGYGELLCCVKIQAVVIL